MKQSRIFRSSMSVVLPFLALTGLTACNGSDGSSGNGKVDLGAVLGTDGIQTPSAAVPAESSASAPQGSPEATAPAPLANASGPSVTVTPTATPAPIPTTVGSTCHTGDSNKICLALRYVGYLDGSGAATVSRDEAIANIAGINALWAQCGIAFQIDEYLSFVPTSRGLLYNTANYSELDQVRSNLATENKLVVVTTGAWNRSGTLGSTGANAWAAMPGSEQLGVILEAPIATYSNIVAHELGHYLNLDHAGDSSNVMSALIYSSSIHFTSSQCTEARNTARGYFTKMMR